MEFKKQNKEKRHKHTTATKDKRLNARNELVVAGGKVGGGWVRELTGIKRHKLSFGRSKWWTGKAQHRPHSR